MASNIRDTISNVGKEVDKLKKVTETMLRSHDGAREALREAIERSSPAKVNLRHAQEEPHDPHRIHVFAKNLEGASPVRSPPSRREHESERKEEDEAVFQNTRILDVSPKTRRYKASDLEHVFQEKIDEQSLRQLDELKAANQQRIRALEESYKGVQEEKRTYWENFHAQIDATKNIMPRQKKGKAFESCTSFPSYGRGLDPDPNFLTFMHNENLNQALGEEVLGAMK